MGTPKKTMADDSGGDGRRPWRGLGGGLWWGLQKQLGRRPWRGRRTTLAGTWRRLYGGRPCRGRTLADDPGGRTTLAGTWLQPGGGRLWRTWRTTLPSLLADGGRPWRGRLTTRDERRGTLHSGRGTTLRLGCDCGRRIWRTWQTTLAWTAGDPGGWRGRLTTLAGRRRATLAGTANDGRLWRTLAETAGDPGRDGGRLAGTADDCGGELADDSVWPLQNQLGGRLYSARGGRPWRGLIYW